MITATLRWSTLWHLKYPRVPKVSYRWIINAIQLAPASVIQLAPIPLCCFLSTMNLHTFHLIILLTLVFFITFRKHAPCGIIQSHLTSRNHIFKNKKGKFSDYFWTSLDSFLSWLDYFWVSYSNQKNIHFWIYLSQQKMNDINAIVIWYFEKTTQQVSKELWRILRQINIS